MNRKKHVVGTSTKRAAIPAHLILAFAVGSGLLTATGRAEAQPHRISDGILALYTFQDTQGPLVRDRSGVGPPIHLRIAEMSKVRRAKGVLEVRGETVIRSEGPPNRLINLVRRQGALTVEAWIQPRQADQEGPARVVTLSRNSTERNVTLGQEGNKWDVRFRTRRTNSNGIPSLTSRSVDLASSVSHVVYTRDRSGDARLYINGEQVARQQVPGSTQNWDRTSQLVLANELNRGRPWLGKFFLVAMYSRALSGKEVHQNYQAGYDVDLESAAVNLARLESNRAFRNEVAPILAQHCLECHDASTKQGGLDLSHKSAAFRGGESGLAIVPGKLRESHLWAQVSTDDMPQNRPSLSAEEKGVLKQWIESGATWTRDFIDPAVYAQGGSVRQNWLRRLTVDEYIATVRAAVDIDISEEARELLPVDLRADGFRNTAYNLSVDLKHIEAYAQLASIIVERMDVVAFADRFSKSRRLTDDDQRELIARMGTWLLRGPLDETELSAFRGISTTVTATGGGFSESTKYILEAMLQSPRFLYRMENQRGDGTAWPADDYELASRMSYILWGAPPDRELMKVTQDGRLYGDEIDKQISRMLRDPRAIERSQEFVTQWLNLSRLENLRPAEAHFPDWSPELAADMRRETLAFCREVLWTQNRPMSDLLDAQVTFVTPRLAKHYGIPLDGALDSDELVKVDLRDNEARGGLLTHGSVLTVGGDEASMVSRGLFVMQNLLRGIVKDPPPCVDTTPVPTKAGLTQRGIAENRIANQACGGCHSKFEPLAFGLEKFDGLGSFHHEDSHGNPLREDGEILFPGEGKSVAYGTSRELMRMLADSDRVPETITWKLVQFSLGRPLVPDDVPFLDKIQNMAHKGGGTYAALVRAIIASELVQATYTEKDS